MLTVTLVASIASAAMWQQWRSVEVEAAERLRAQNVWILHGAMDWARLILREDKKASQDVDDLTEPWAVPLAESRLSTFLAAEGGSATDEPGADESFLSGRISDQQALLNVNNLVSADGKVSSLWLPCFARLFTWLNLPVTELSALAENLALAKAQGDNRAGGLAPLQPERLAELQWLGLSPSTLTRLAPYITLLPAATPVNLNTAAAAVIYAVIPGLDLAGAERMVAQRERQPFRTTTDAFKFAGGAQINDAVHKVWSSFFAVRGRLRTARGVVEELSLLQREGQEVKILRRERVLPEAPALNADGSPANAGRDFSSLTQR